MSEPKNNETPKGAMIEKLSRAWDQRAEYHGGKQTDSYRLYHGYGEGMPGLTIDRFGNDLIINSKIALDSETLFPCSGKNVSSATNVPHTNSSL